MAIDEANPEKMQRSCSLVVTKFVAGRWIDAGKLPARDMDGCKQSRGDKINLPTTFDL